MSSIGSAATVPIDVRIQPDNNSSQQLLPSSPVPISSRVVVSVPQLLPRRQSRGSINDSDGVQASPTASSNSTKKAKATANEDSARSEEEGGNGGGVLLDQLGFPSPRPASKCSLLCCFYAEFDNTVGPKICFQTPLHFMDQDILVSLDSINQTLDETFQNILYPQEESSAKEKDGSSQAESSLERETTGAAPPATTTGGDTSKNNPKQQRGANDPVLSEGSLSIFDSTSEYIITGNELTGNIINLSAHNMHILTRPTIISDERYERNSLLFCVGFVLRRTEDPRPFRPILSKLAITLRSMEIETQFLSKNGTRPQLQQLLDRILVSLNSPKGETNLILKTGVLNLKLFQSPKLPAFPVPDYTVPIMLRKDWQVQMYDWDLAINWVVLHIDGVANARQISKKAEIDMEIVRACLRVLRHHRVIALTDMFFYSNRYECTDKAAAMLAGREPKLLQDAVEYIIKRPPTSPFLGSSSPKQPGSPSSTTNNPPSTGGSYPPARVPLKLAAESLQGGEQFPWLATIRREDQRELRAAVAELYCACNRNTSFGDLWITLTSDRFAVGRSATDKHGSTTTSSTTTRGRTPIRDRFRNDHHHNHRDGSDEQQHGEWGGGMATSPSPMIDSYLDSLRRTSVGGRTSSIDWKHVFAMCDHRRFTSFGIVHGLIVRVHKLPFVLDTNYSGGVKGGTNKNLEQQKQQLMHPLDNNEGRPSSSKYYVNNNKSESDEQYRLAHAVASMMDGTHCDDEIVCNFPQYPIDELIELVERMEYKKIVSIYSVTSELE